MQNYELSILIPARNEEFLHLTVQDILKNKRGNTEIIVGCDGNFPLTPIQDHPDVTIYYSPVPLGQRAMTNQLARLSQAKYIAKADAHLAYDEGFDVKLMEVMQDDWTLVPNMKNLHVFDWVCKNGHRRYQGGAGKCKECDEPTEKEIVWRAKPSPNSTSFCFDTDLHFQYFGDFKKREEGKGKITESFSLQGSFFMVTREKYWELNLCDEEFGSWGQQGVEVALKTWLSGGKVKVLHDTWYAHLFRTQPGFGFPYKQSGKQIAHARKRSKELFLENKWDKQIYPLSWLLEKFKPVKYWHDKEGKEMLDYVNKKGFEFTQNKVDKVSMDFVNKKLDENTVDMLTGSYQYKQSVNTFSPDEVKRKGIIFYTDNKLNLKIARAVQRQLLSIELPIVSSSLKPMNFGKNVHIPLDRGKLTMFIQILSALKASDSDIVYFCEHDVLYHPSHFKFTPPTSDKFYYNENVWKVDAQSDKAIHYEARQVSGIVVYRKLAIEHYTRRIQEIEKRGFSMKMGYEPGTHNREERVDDLTSEGFMSDYPNVDIRHGNNLSPTRWKREEFRNQKYTKGWREGTLKDIPGWDFSQGLTKPQIA